MTRACLALTHGHFAEAWRYHPFSFLVLGLAIGIAFFPVHLKNRWIGYPLKNPKFNLYFRNCVLLVHLDFQDFHTDFRSVGNRWFPAL